MNGCRDQSNSDNISLGWLTRFRGSVHSPHGRKPGSVQAGLALEELRILHLVSKGKQEKTGSGAARRRVSKPTPTVTHSNKDTLSNSVGQVLKHMSLRGQTYSDNYILLCRHGCLSSDLRDHVKAGIPAHTWHGEAESG